MTVCHWLVMNPRAPQVRQSPAGPCGLLGLRKKKPGLGHGLGAAPAALSYLFKCEGAAALCALRVCVCARARRRNDETERATLLWRRTGRLTETTTDDEICCARTFLASAAHRVPPPPTASSGSWTRPLLVNARARRAHLSPPGRT